jgi:hypothetical protein
VKCARHHIDIPADTCRQRQRLELESCRGCSQEDRPPANGTDPKKAKHRANGLKGAKARTENQRSRKELAAAMLGERR